MSAIDMNSVLVGLETYPTWSEKGEPQLISFSQRNIEENFLISGVSSDAVNVEKVSVKYDFANVLDEACMKVPKGSIYALLGPSGCGKTTLLKCLLGQLKPDSGCISVFGRIVDGVGDVGVAIGYMPQEDGLYDSFTVEETLQYFGILAGMNLSAVKIQTSDLCSLLELPQGSKQLAYNLSGGERRRLSLAVSLIQNPSLLILDEPTVGIDVTLRRKIWRHLIQLTRERQTTVILTTHYISEANDANLVAFMKEGKIICETSPNQLFDTLGVKSLEAAFLELCRNGISYGKGENQIYSLDNNNNQCSGALSFPLERGFHCQARKRFSGLRAHVWKNYVTEKHYSVLSVFKVIIVVAQAFLYPVLLGEKATYIPVTVVNNDDDILGNSFVQSVDKEIYDITFADSLAEGMHRFDTSQNWAVFHFPLNYTENVLDLRYLFEEIGTDYDCNITSSDFQFHVYSDNTNSIIRRDVLKELYNVLTRMRGNLSTEFRYYLQMADIPFDKVFPGDGIERTQNAGLQAGEVVAIIFIMNLFLAAIQMQMEYKNGFLERSLVAGLTVSEMLLSFTVSALPHAVIEAILLQTVFVEYFAIPISHRGFTFVLQMLLSVSGTLGGLALSALASSKLQWAFFLIPTYFHTSMLSGLVISSKKFPKHFQYFSKLIPTGQAIWSFKYLWLRQWPLSNVYVLAGLLPPILSSLFFYLIACWALRRKYFRK